MQGSDVVTDGPPGSPPEVRRNAGSKRKLSAWLNQFQCSEYTLLGFATASSVALNLNSRRAEDYQCEVIKSQIASGERRRITNDFARQSVGGHISVFYDEIERALFPIVGALW